MQKKSELIRQTYLFREVLEDPLIKSMYIGFESFPLGACNDASIMLGLYLEEIGLGEFYFTLAENEYGLTHSWLENKQYLIDITADQFSGTEKVIIKLLVEKTDTQLHLGFTVKSIKHVTQNAVSGVFIADFLKTQTKIKEIILIKNSCNSTYKQS